MAGSKIGAAKAVETTKKFHGEDFYVRAGKVGGKAKGFKKGFANMPTEKVQAAGRLGGANGRRTWTATERATFSRAMKQAHARKKAQAWLTSSVESSATNGSMTSTSLPTDYTPYRFRIAIVQCVRSGEMTYEHVQAQA